jgi:hypothetical protein
VARSWRSNEVGRLILASGSALTSLRLDVRTLDDTSSLDFPHFHMRPQLTSDAVQWLLRHANLIIYLPMACPDLRQALALVPSPTASHIAGNLLI